VRGQPLPVPLSDRSSPALHVVRLGEIVNLREVWRSFVPYGLFLVLLIAGWSELPGGDAILPWYVTVASAAVPACISRFWR
jgi:hypothetical protein